MNHSIIFIFLDGFGLAPPGYLNPHQPNKMPFLESLLGSTLLSNLKISKTNLLLNSIDASLGVPGLPQSATGQTSLFTGKNAAHLLGFHCPAFPDKRLIKIIQKYNLYQALAHLGKSSIFANAYSPLYFKLVKEKKRRHSVTTHCVLSAGLPFLTMYDLQLGRAIFWDITRDLLESYPLIKRKYSPISAYEAGKHLANIAQNYDFTVFESFLPDLIGHKRDLAKAYKFLNILDTFIESLYLKLQANQTIILTSDHGNLEDLSTGNHTQNPVPLLVIGKAASFFNQANSIIDLAPLIIEFYKKGCPT